MKVINRCGTLVSFNKASVSLAVGLQGPVVAGLIQKGLLKVLEEINLVLGFCCAGQE